MIPDKALELAALTAAISATADMTNVLNLGTADVKLGVRTSDLDAKARKVFMRVIITADGTGTGTARFSVITDDNASLTSDSEIGTNVAAVGTTFKKGDVIDVPFTGSDLEQYLSGKCTITGTVGIKFSAYIYHAV